MERTAFSARLDAFDALLMRRDDVISYLYAGQMIKAIKIYREDTGASLADAKAAVERMEQRMRLNMPPLAESAPAETPAASFGEIDAWRGEIKRLISQGNKINAIKFYREQTGAGLREAKDIIDQLADEMSLRGSSFSQPGVWATELPSYTSDHRYASAAESPGEDVRRLVLAGKKIHAIKLYREQTGVGLREAKDVIDEMERALGM